MPADYVQMLATAGAAAALAGVGVASLMRGGRRQVRPKEGRQVTKSVVAPGPCIPQPHLLPPARAALPCMHAPAFRISAAPPPCHPALTYSSPLPLRLYRPNYAPPCCPAPSAVPPPPHTRPHPPFTHLCVLPLPYVRGAQGPLRSPPPSPPPLQAPLSPDVERLLAKAQEVHREQQQQRFGDTGIKPTAGEAAGGVPLAAVLQALEESRRALGVTTAAGGRGGAAQASGEKEGLH